MTTPDLDAHEQRLRGAVKAAAFDHYHPGSPDQLQPHEPKDCPVMNYTLDALLAFVRARALASRGCERRSEVGTCIDKKFQAPCWGCQRQAELDRLVQQEGAQQR